MNETVELYPAYKWNCPACGKENFERIVPENDDVWKIPNEVCCDFCDSVFPTYDQFEGREDEDFDPSTDAGPMETDI